MAQNLDIKRRLLHAVVQENIATLADEALPTTAPPGSTPYVRQQGQRQPRAWLWRTLLVAVALVLLPAYEMSTITEHLRQRLPAFLPFSLPAHEMSTVTEHRAEGRHPASLEARLPEEVFPAPVPLDLTVVPLGVRKIVLDSGHGGKDIGAAAPLGTVEKEVALDIGLRLRRLLETAAFEVFMTRDKDETVSLAQRAAFANARSADLFVSIHVNWIEGRHNRGMETYYLGPTDDPDLLQLAAQENQASGYSLADFRRLLDGIYIAVRRDESRRLAETMQHALFQSLRPVNPTLVNRGVKMAPFVVLVATEMPAILAEVSCLSNAEEARLLATPEYRQAIAQALFQGIRAYAQALNSSAKKGS
jgi:N-acetylmuramoyl-L-alanine amidase